MADSLIQSIQRAATYIYPYLGTVKPRVGIILGSGLGNLGSSLDNLTTIPYSDIPGFPKATAIGHKGNLLIGKLGNTDVVAMQGRFHYYEGHPMEDITFPVRVLAAIGIEYLFVSNAAGGINPEYRCGDLMIMSDHINLQPNPLLGPNLDTLGPRFPDMSASYDPKLRELAHKVAEEDGINVHEGVYVAFTGPSYETHAELYFARKIGGDVVGMSTTPEVIVARHMGLKVFGVSVVTDVFNPEDPSYAVDEQEVLVQADKASKKMTQLFCRVINSL